MLFTAKPFSICWYADNCTMACFLNFSEIKQFSRKTKGLSSYLLQVIMGKWKFCVVKCLEILNLSTQHEFPNILDLSFYDSDLLLFSKLNTSNIRQTISVAQTVTNEEGGTYIKWYLWRLRCLVTLRDKEKKTMLYGFWCMCSWKLKENSEEGSVSCLVGNEKNIVVLNVV